MLSGMKLEISGRGRAPSNREKRMTADMKLFQHAEPFDATQQGRAERSLDKGGAQGCKGNASKLQANMVG
jgi:hypothetical protein